MGIGIRFDGFDTVGETIEICRLAEQAGVTGLWMTEHIGYREALVSCMAFAGATESATVYPAAVTPYLFHPTPTAMSLATMAELYPGRVGVSVAVGNTLDLKESGKEPGDGVTAVEDYIADLRALWTTEPTESTAESYRLNGARMSFAPPDIPIFVTALGSDVAKAAGNTADGILLSAGFSTAFVSHCLSMFEEGASESGRDAAKLRNAGNIHFAVSGDGKSARENVRRKLGFLFRNRLMAENIVAAGIPIDQDAIVDAVAARDLDKAASLVPDEAVEAFGVAGTPGECAQRLQAYIEAGLQEPVIQVSGTEEEKQLALEVIREFTGG
ncbi:MAG: LLM class flavin-dependent oxidoreductase [Rhodospirillaceae bacterium]|nr:LLM class flavin-dependent oxidoreductase [Rhodospirillaceae bacterium]